MPFKRKSSWKFSWEEEKEKGNEFIKPISTDRVYKSWTRALSGVSDSEEIPRRIAQPSSRTGSDEKAARRVGGVLVIHYHNKPIGVLGAPNILRDILLAWRGAGSATLHPKIKDELALLADSAKPAPAQPLNPSTLQVRRRPNDLGRFLHGQAKQGGIVAILYFQTTYAFLIPLPILARFRREAKEATPWTDAILNWLSLPDHAPVKIRTEWL